MSLPGENKLAFYRAFATNNLEQKIVSCALKFTPPADTWGRSRKGKNFLIGARQIIQVEVI